MYHSQLVEVASTHFRSWSGLCLQWVVGVVRANVGGPRVCLRRKARDVVESESRNQVKPSETQWNPVKPNETKWNQVKPSETLGVKHFDELMVTWWPSYQVTKWFLGQSSGAHSCVSDIVRCSRSPVSHDAERPEPENQVRSATAHMVEICRNQTLKFVAWYDICYVSYVIWYNSCFFLTLFHESEVPRQNGSMQHPNLGPSPGGFLQAVL